MATRARTIEGRADFPLPDRRTFPPPRWWTALAEKADAPAARMFAAGLAVRVLFLTVARTFVFRDGFGFGWEAGRIARALAAGRGFADPFHGQTGPTAWLAPVYPLVLAAVFKAFGTYSALSGWTILTFNSVCSALIAPLLAALGRDVFDERIGRRAGWTWALLPYAVYWPTRVVWDTCLTALLLALVFLLTVRVARAPSTAGWCALGLSWGLLALTNPAPLSFAPASAAWVLWPRGGDATGRRRGALAAALLALALVSPWLVRNARALGAPVFIRDNFGEELRLGNGPGASGIWMAWLHPTQDPLQLEAYRRMGEVAYVAQRQREAVDAIRAQPRAFAASTARRIYWFWCGTTKGEAASLGALARTAAFTTSSVLALGGLALLVWRRRAEALLFGALLVSFPAVYYVTFVIPRYRHPIEPEMLLLGVALVSSLATTRAAGAARRNEGARAPRD